jgi:RNA polymerase sigma factor (sigma-70 family)
MAPTTKSVALEDSVELARAGNRAALETVIELVQDKIYGLALRMLWHPEDARDATQEILIRVIPHLGGFRRESAFMTWTYRIAANYLTSVRKSRLEEQRYTFERFGRELDEGLSELPSPAVNQAEQAVLLQEVRIGCTMGMLFCLDRPHRLAYILGKILALDNREAADVLGIAPAALPSDCELSRRAPCCLVGAQPLKSSEGQPPCGFESCPRPFFTNSNGTFVATGAIAVKRRAHRC